MEKNEGTWSSDVLWICELSLVRLCFHCYSDIFNVLQITFKMVFSKRGNQWERQFYCIWVWCSARLSWKITYLPHLAIKVPKIPGGGAGGETKHVKLCYNNIVFEAACHLHQQARKITAKDNLPVNYLKNTKWKFSSRCRMTRNICFL